MTTPRQIILDCDPGHDDAIALMMAMASPELDIRGLTIVAGNNTIANTTNKFATWFFL